VGRECGGRERDVLNQQLGVAGLGGFSAQVMCMYAEGTTSLVGVTIHFVLMEGVAIQENPIADICRCSRSAVYFVPNMYSYRSPSFRLNDLSGILGEPAVSRIMFIVNMRLVVRTRR
jgi:hypothetical protein